MRLFYKECEVCGTKINKLQSWWNIFLLKIGGKVTCPNCKSGYRTSKLFSYLGKYYTWIFLLTIYNESYLIKSKLDILCLIIIYIILEFIIMIILPLKKVENNDDKNITKSHKFIYFVSTIILSFVLVFSTLYLFMNLSSWYYYIKHPEILGEDDLGGPIFVVSSSFITEIVIFPLLIFASIEIIKYIIKKKSK